MANSAVWTREDQKVSFGVGDTVSVHFALEEGDKKKNSIFEGVVIAIKNEKESKTFTVRKIGSLRIGVERIWPLNSPWIKKLVVKKKGDVRRAKLYYLRKTK